MDLQEPPYDAVIVGGSFAGLAAALQLARARRRVLVLDTGTPRNRFAHASYGFLGQDGRPPQEILATARQQLLAYPTVIFENAEATHAEKEAQSFRITLNGGTSVIAKRLILATGVKDYLPDIPGMQELWGTGVAHCPYCHGYEVAGRPFAVFAVGPMSVHQALLVRDWSDQVTLLTNGTVSLSDADRSQLHARDIGIETTPVARLIAEGDELAAVIFTDGRQVAFGALFTAPRSELASPLAQQLSCELEPGAFGPIVKTNAFKESTVPGVYVAGDAARAAPRVTMAVADGMTAGIAAHRSLVFPNH